MLDLWDFLRNLIPKFLDRIRMTGCRIKPVWPIEGYSKSFTSCQTLFSGISVLLLHWYCKCTSAKTKSRFACKEDSPVLIFRYRLNSCFIKQDETNSSNLGCEINLWCISVIFPVMISLISFWRYTPLVHMSSVKWKWKSLAPDKVDHRLKTAKIQHREGECDFFSRFQMHCSCSHRKFRTANWPIPRCPTLHQLPLTIHHRCRGPNPTFVVFSVEYSIEWSNTSRFVQRIAGCTRERQQGLFCGTLSNVVRIEFLMISLQHQLKKIPQIIISSISTLEPETRCGWVCLEEISSHTNSG